MQDSEKIDELVDEHGLDRENIAPLEGEDCLDTIYQRFNTEVAADGGTQTESGDGGTEPEPDRENEATTDDTGFTDSQKEFIRDAVKQQNSTDRKNELVTQITAANDARDEERLNEMSVDALEAIADEQSASNEQTETRTNMAGVPQDVEHDASGLGEEDVSDVPSGEWDDYSDVGGD